MGETGKPEGQLPAAVSVPSCGAAVCGQCGAVLGILTAWLLPQTLG